METDLPSLKSWSIIFLLFSFSALPKVFRSFKSDTSKWANDLATEELFKSLLVRNGKFLSASAPSSCKNFSSIFSAHSFSKAVLVYSFSAAWLKCPFHILLYLKLPLFYKRTAKIIISSTIQIAKRYYLQVMAFNILPTPCLIVKRLIFSYSWLPKTLRCSWFPSFAGL